MRTLRPLSSADDDDDDAMAGAADTLRAMLRQEQALRRRDYLHGDTDRDEDEAGCGDSSCSYASSTATIPATATNITDDAGPATTTPAIVVTEADRTAVVDWCYSIVDACDIDREVVAAAMDAVDRFLSREYPDEKGRGDGHQSYLSDTRQYQLLVISSLYLSAKVHDSSIALSSAALAEACADLYTAVEIEAMERAILEGLDWRMHAAPTGVQLAYHLLAVAMRHAQADDKDANNDDAVDESTLLFLLDEVRFHAEYAVRSYHFSTRRPSTAALASIFNALEHLDDVRARWVMVRALLRALGEYDFACPSELVAAKDKLREVVERDSPEDGDGREAALSEPSSSARKYDGAVADRFDDSKSPRTILNIIEY